MILKWDALIKVIAHASRVLLFGPPGTSKSHTATHAPLPTLKTPVFNITLTEETPAAEVRGHFVPSGAGEFGWMDGPALRWWREGGRLVLNEVDKAGPDLQSLLLSILDNPEVAALTLPTGETVRPDKSKWRQVIGTMNAVPEELTEPLRERLMPAILVDVPHPGAFEIIPEAYRAQAKKGLCIPDSDRKISLREWHAFAGLVMATGDEALAAQAVFGSSAKGLMASIKIAK